MVEKSKTHRKKGGSKFIFVGKMLHDVLYTALQDVAQPVDGVGFHVQILAEPVKLGAVDIVVRIEGVLGDVALFHGFPETVISDHAAPPKLCLT